MNEQTSSREPNAARAGLGKSGDAAATDGRRRILDAALEEFAIHGFIGASIRQIGRRAEAQHQLIIHHFKNKETLWEAVVAEQLRETTEVYERILAAEQEVGAAAALRLLLRELVNWAARKPAFHRVVAYEAQAGSPRLNWLIENYLKVLYATASRLIENAQQEGAARPGETHQLFFAFMGIVSNRFQNPAAFRMLTGRDPSDPAEVDEAYRLACGFLGLSAE